MEMNKSYIFIPFQTFEDSTDTVEPQLSEPSNRLTMGSDNQGVWLDEGNQNSPSMGYQVSDNFLCTKDR